MPTLNEIDAELSRLRRLADKRRGVAGYEANVEAVEGRIAALEAQRQALPDHKV